MFEALHAVIYYQQPAALWRQCAALAQASAQAGWRWRYVADEHSCAQAQAGLAEGGLDLAGGTVLDSAALRLRASPIRVAPIVAALRAEIAHTLEGGGAGVLLLIEMAWTIRTPSGAVYLREYEAALHELQQQLPVAFVCLYNQHVLLDAQLLAGLHTHAHVYGTGGPRANPFFVPPAIYTRRDVRAQFRHWLGTIDPPAAAPADPPAPAAPLAEGEPIYHLETLNPPISEQSDQGRWKIRCFGQLRVYREDGALVDWRVEKGATRKTKTLFAYLLHRGAAGAGAEELASLLWPEAGDTRQGMNRLYHVVNSLRHALSPGLPANRASPFVRLQDQRYTLAVPPNTWIDLPMFQELCYRGATLLAQGAADEALLCYQSAERLYTGDYLADIPTQYADSAEEDWCWGRRYWLRDMHLKMLYSMAGIYRQLRRFPEALAYADRALRTDPCCEPAHQAKLLVLRDTRRRDALERQYRLYCQTLAQLDLGPPSPEMQELYQRLRAELTV